MIKDFQGIEHETITDMCWYYAISVSAYNKRNSTGASNIDVLLGGSNYKTWGHGTVEDFKGRKFKSINEMFDFWSKHTGISKQTYMKRHKSNDPKFANIIDVLLCPAIKGRMYYKTVTEYLNEKELGENTTESEENVIESLIDKIDLSMLQEENKKLKAKIERIRSKLSLLDELLQQVDWAVKDLYSNFVEFDDCDEDNDND